MKTLYKVFNTVTFHSRIVAIVLFIGVIPACAFWAGLKVAKMGFDEQRIQQLTAQTLYDAQNNICWTRVNSCPQSLTQPQATDATISVTSPIKGEKIDPALPITVSWNTSGNFPYQKMAILILDSTGRAAAKTVTTENIGRVNIPAPTKITKSPYSILVQAVSATKNSDTPFAYSESFYFLIR